MYQLEQDVEEIRQALKHMVGRHDQRTHGNRFSGGGSARSLVHHGGGAPGHNVIRDSNGEITGVRIRARKKPKPADASIVTPPVGHQTVKGKEMSEDELLKSNTMQELVNLDRVTIKNDGDKTLASLYHDQGFDGKPDVVSEDELNAAVANGDREFYRGTMEGSGTQFSDAFKDGEYYAGYGGYGNGTYMAYSDLAGAALAETRGYGDSAMHIAVKKDAKIGNYNKIVNEADDLARETQKEIARLSGQVGPGMSMVQYGAINTKIKEKQNLLDIYKDYGKYAVTKGYDGFDVSASRSTAGDFNYAGYFVLLNRTAARVSTQLFKKKGL